MFNSATLATRSKSLLIVMLVALGALAGPFVSAAAAAPQGLQGIGGAIFFGDSDCASGAYSSAGLGSTPTWGLHYGMDFPVIGTGTGYRVVLCGPMGESRHYRQHDEVYISRSGATCMNWGSHGVAPGTGYLSTGYTPEIELSDVRVDTVLDYVLPLPAVTTVTVSARYRNVASGETGTLSGVVHYWTSSYCATNEARQSVVVTPTLAMTPD